MSLFVGFGVFTQHIQLIVHADVFHNSKPETVRRLKMIWNIHISTYIHTYICIFSGRHVLPQLGTQREEVIFIILESGGSTI